MREFCNDFIDMGGQFHYMTVHPKCRFSKKSACKRGQIVTKQAEPLRSKLRKAFKDMAVKQGLKGVNYLQYSTWDHKFIGLPNGIDFSKFKNLKVDQLLQISKNLNAGHIRLIIKKDK